MPSDVVDRFMLWSSGRPAVTAILALLVLAVLLYGVLIQQELFLVLWFLLVLFFAHLALRFVRAFERIAGATERYVDRDPAAED